MPVNKSAMRRYLVIDAALNNKYRPYPDKERLLELIEEKVGQISAAMVDKDMHAMRFDETLGFFAPIAYSKKHKGYHYTESNYSILQHPVSEEDIDALKDAAATLDNYSGLPVFAQFRDSIRKINEKLKWSEGEKERELEKIILFESNDQASGVQWISDVLKAIRSRTVLEFTYENIYKNTFNRYRIHPYLLKEYRSRWYLIGWSPEKKDIRTFGLDRVTALDSTNDSFTKRKDFEPDLFFRYSFGITEHAEQPQSIELWCSPILSKLLLRQPLHATQKKVKEQETGTTFKFRLLITEDLIQLLLSYNTHVRVLQPQRLRDELVQRLQATLNRYR